MRAPAGFPPGSAARPAAPDLSERAERTRRDRTSTSGLRSSKIDDTLTRITAAHAGVTLARPGTSGAVQTEDAPAVAKPKRRGITLVKLVVGALALAVLTTSSVGWGAKRWLDSGITTVAALEPDAGAIVNADAQQGDENVLIVANDPAATGGTGTRADTLTVAHVPAGGGPMAVLSFPPGMEIDRPACERWDSGSGTYLTEVVPAEARTQLVSALDIGGPRCATRVVQQLSGIAITGFVGFDVGAIGALANAVGGIGICAPRPVVDKVLGPVVPTAGRVTLDGLSGTDYVRSVEVQGDPASGRGRIERQQILLGAVLQQAIGSTGLLDFRQLVELRPALGRALMTDAVGLDEALSLARSLQNLEADGVTFAPVPTGTGSGPGSVTIRGTDAAALFSAVRADTPLPAQSGGPGSAPAPSPAGMKVAVLNATDRTGLGATVSDTLGSLGFGIGDVGTAEQTTEQTLIRFSPDQTDNAALLGTSVPSATPVPDPGTTGVLQLVIGRSYDDVLRPPAAPAEAGGAPAEAEPPRTACG